MPIDLLIDLSWLLVVLPAIPLVVFIIETGLGIAKSLPRSLSAGMPSTVILVPAHNEALIIGETLEKLNLALPDRASILVIADNCSDHTAAVVRELGYLVLERSDPERRGKGYALAHGRDHLSGSPPECIIVFDADCRSDRQSLADLARHCRAHMLPVQAGYIFEADRAASPKVQISSFAFWLKNVVRQRGASRVGGAAILTGTGMAFPWASFDQLALATGNIVEDLAMCVELTRSGRGPIFLDQAMVTSVAASEGATLEQRARWEHGYISTAGNHAVPMIWHGLRTWSWPPLWLGLHLLVPPLALLFFLSVLCLMLSVGIGVITSAWLPALCLTALLAAASGLVCANWVIAGHKWLTPRAVFMIPLYLVWKIPLYVRFLAGRKAQWTRTER